MKGLIKMTFAALGLVALSSCSNDEFFGFGSNEQAKGDIKVNVEELIDAETTRAAYIPSGTDQKSGTLVWETGDLIKITDGNLLRYDFYKFDTDRFVFDAASTGRESTWISEPEWAAFSTGGAGNAAMFNIENAKKQAIADFTINAQQQWDDTNADGSFSAEIPLWGTAATDAEYGVAVDLKYLTGVMKINLENVPGNAKEIIIQGWANMAETSPAPMTGTFRAILATDDEINNDAQLETVAGNAYNNWIRVDVSKATKAKSSLFIPMIAQKYSSLSVYYTTASHTGVGTLDDAPAGTHITATATTGYKLNTDLFLVKNVKNVTFARRQYRNLNYTEFKVSGASAKDLSTFLEAQKDKNPVDVTTEQATELTAEDNTITLPNSASTIWLTLDKVKASGSTILNIRGDGFTGTFGLIIKDNVDGSAISNVYVNVPNGHVLFASNDVTNTVTLGGDAGAGVNEVDALIAKSLTIGSPTIATKVAAVYPNAELGYGNTDGADLKLVKGSTIVAAPRLETNTQIDLVEIDGTLPETDFSTYKTSGAATPIVINLAIGNGAAITGPITTLGNVTMTGGKITGNLVADGNITISGVTDGTAGTEKGTVTGNIQGKTDLTTNTTKTITLSEEATVQGTIAPVAAKLSYDLIVNGKAQVNEATVNDLTINGTTASVGTATVAGNASITDTEEVEAISTVLNMNVNKTLTYNGGYIKKIKITENATQVLTIALGESATNYTAIADIKSSADAATTKFKFTGKSVWNGKKIGDGTAAAGKAAIIAAYAPATKVDIFTANELASIAATATATLYNNIDLGGQAWTCPAFACSTFQGANIGTAKAPVYPTIEGLKLVADATEAAVSGVGLFSTAAADATIKNLNIKTVTSVVTGEKDVTDFGTLIGKADAGVTVNNVKVESANLATAAKTTLVGNVGGLVGSAVNDVAIDGVTITGLTLNGWYNIGGIAGSVTADGKTVKTTKTIAANTVNVTAINVPAEFNADADIYQVAVNDPYFGSIGMLVGQAKVVPSIAVTSLTINDLITGHKKALGYKFVYNNPGPDVRFYYGVKGNVNIGRLTGVAMSDVTTADGFAGAAADTQIMLHNSLWTGNE